MEERERRIGRNEAVFREANGRIQELNQIFATFTDELVLVCECGDGQLAFDLYAARGVARGTSRTRSWCSASTPPRGSRASRHSGSNRRSPASACPTRSHADDKRRAAGAGRVLMQHRHERVHVVALEGIDIAGEEVHIPRAVDA
jgi:hypothetical protein